MLACDLSGFSIICQIRECEDLIHGAYQKKLSLGWVTRPKTSQFLAFFYETLKVGAFLEMYVELVFNATTWMYLR